MDLQTQLPMESMRFNQIDYDAKILLVGSCFSDNIGAKFAYYKFQHLVNPHGILFHPMAIETFITSVINERVYTEDDTFYLNEQWHCFDAHSRLSNPNQSELLKELNHQIQQSAVFLKEASHIIITLGTAWVYREISSDKVVANCHKVPQKKFHKALLSVDEVTQSIDAMIALIKSINSKVSFLFTVSPVRHLKDGFIENTRSKSHLIAAIHNVIESQGTSSNIHYFPSYELMMDELRDYRFYNSDMIHPTTTAINYIWEKFSKTWIGPTASQMMNDIHSIQQSLSHKPNHPQSEAHRTFLLNLEQRIMAVEKQYPHISFK